jgi:sporulation protein YlmC with PRC-barrel domain
MILNCKELTRYDVAATDGSLGDVQDLLFDENEWTVRQIVVKTDGFLVHHSVLVAPADVAEIELPSETLRLNLSKVEVNEKSNAAIKRQADSGVRAASAKCGASAIEPALASANAAADYDLLAVDGRVGLVHGMLIDTETWRIRYIVVDAGEWLENRFILLSPRVIRSLDHNDRVLLTNVTKRQVQDSPPYDADVELSRDWEAFLYDYYGWPRDW